MKKLSLLFIALCATISLQANVSEPYYSSVTVDSVVIICEMTIDGVEIPDFDQYDSLYTVALPYGTSVLPLVGFVECDSMVSGWTAEYLSGDTVAPGITTYWATGPGVVFGPYTITWTIDDPLSLAEMDNNTIVLSPNPANGIVNIYLNKSSSSSIYLMDLSGRQMQTIETEKGQDHYQMILSDYASGIYFIKVVQDGNLIQNEKLVIE